MADGLFVNRRGSGPPVVLVHGSMDTSGSFRAVDDLLSGFTVIRYDRRGYGRSDPSSVPFDGHVDDLLGLLEEPSLLVGHSLGGLIALVAAVRKPELVRGVLAYETPLRWLPWWPIRAPSADPDVERVAAEAFLRRHLGADRWDRLPAERRGRFLSWAPAWGEELRTCGDPGLLDPADVRVPVLVARGEGAEDRHVRGTGWLAERLPESRLVTIAATTHAAHRAQPKEFAALVDEAAAWVGHE